MKLHNGILFLSLSSAIGYASQQTYYTKLPNGDIVPKALAAKEVKSQSKKRLQAYDDNMCVIDDGVNQACVAHATEVRVGYALEQVTDTDDNSTDSLDYYYWQI